MLHFIVFSKNSKRILRGGTCLPKMYHTEVRTADECIMKTNGQVDDVTKKIEFDGFDDKGQPINPRVVDKTSAEIKQDYFKPEPKPYGKYRANITNDQWQSLLRRIRNLENNEEKG